MEDLFNQLEVCGSSYHRCLPRAKAWCKVDMNEACYGLLFRSISKEHKLGKEMARSVYASQPTRRMGKTQTVMNVLFGPPPQLRFNGIGITI